MNEDVMFFDEWISYEDRKKIEESDLTDYGKARQFARCACANFAKAKAMSKDFEKKIVPDLEQLKKQRQEEGEQNLMFVTLPDGDMILLDARGVVIGTQRAAS